MAIGGYYINGYQLLFYLWLLVVIPLMVIGGYSILMVNGSYSINGYQLLFYQWLLVVIDDYYINGYW